MLYNELLTTSDFVISVSGLTTKGIYISVSMDNRLLKAEYEYNNYHIASFL